MSDEATLFNEALAKESPQERSAYLDQAAGGDVELRARVEVLLAAHDRAGSFLEASPTSITHPAVDGVEQPSAEGPGAVIGAYKLLEQIGEGDMGAVFMAEQLHPVRRRVALKIIKPGMDTRKVIARFEAERQALALMDHPNIAKVLEAGATQAGRPYFVMELVKGIPITEYCDQQKLSPRQRLSLFVQVCQAVQHAHQKGIIHRDLKPNNVLVTLQDGKPTPKVIDFGIAKATAGQRLTDQTLFTELRQLVGTPLYMSPEQAEMSALMDTDTRSDVYSLGVLLYELLTGTTPFEKQRLAKAAYDEVRRIIREEEPPRPSTRISTLGETLTSVSAQRQTDPKKLSGLLRGELDWIVMRALEKDRTRRYDTASGLAQDVERYLADQPVEACPPSRFYRMRKFVRRNKAAIATTSFIATVLVVSTAVSTRAAVRAKWAERQITHERDQVVAEKRRADEQAAIAKAINDFLNKDVLGQADVDNQVDRNFTPDPDVKVRDVLDRAAAGIAGRFGSQPLVEAAIRHTIGEAYLSLAEYQTSEEHLQAAVRVRRQLLGDAHADTRETLDSLCELYIRSEQLPKAEALLMPALQSQRQTLGGKHPDTLRTMHRLGELYFEQAKNAEAVQLFKEAMDGQRAVLGETDEQTLYTSYRLAEAHWYNHDDGKAEKLLCDILDIEGKQHRDHRNLSILTRDTLGTLYSLQGLPKKGEPLVLEALEDTRRADQRRLDSFNGRNEIVILHHLARLYNCDGQFAEAERQALEALDTARKRFGEYHVVTTLALCNLGETYFIQRQFEKAEPILLHYLDGVQNGYRRDEGFLIALDSLSNLYRRKQQYDKAVPYLEQALEAARKRYGENNPSVRTFADKLADLSKERALWHWRNGTLSGADAEIVEIIDLGNSDEPAAVHARAGLYKRIGRFAGALADQTRAVKLDPSDRESWEDVAALNLYLGNETEFRAAREVLLSRFGQTSGDHPGKICLLGPLQDEEAKAVMAMVDRALSSGASAYTLQYFHAAKGMAEYRSRNYVQALKWLRLSRDALTRTIAARDGWDRFIWDEVRTTDDFFIAMSQYHLGDRQAARDTLALAQEQLRTQVPSESSCNMKVGWIDWLMVQIIAREAEKLILVNDPTTMPATRPSTTRPASPATTPAP